MASRPSISPPDDDGQRSLPHGALKPTYADAYNVLESMGEALTPALSSHALRRIGRRDRGRRQSRQW